MATVNRSNIGNLHDKLTVVLSTEDYLKNFEKSLKEYSKNVNMPGFRKGQVPTGMIKKMYGNSVFVDEILKTAYDQVNAYLNEHKPLILGQPVPMEMDTKQMLDYKNPTEYTFEFEIGLKPEFSIKSIEEKSPITKYQISINDEMIDREVEALRKRAGKLEDIEAQNDDANLMYFTFVAEGAEDNTGVEDVAEYGRMPELLKEAFKGAKAGHTFSFQPAQIEDEKLRTDFIKHALKATDEVANNTYTGTLTKVATLVPREMNDEFFAEVFPGTEVKDEATFRAELTKAIEEQIEKFASERLQNDIFENLVHTTEFELPTTFLKRWLEVGGEKPKTKEEVENEFPTFEHQLRWTLISDQLMQKYQVAVTYEEIVNDIKERVSAYFGINDGGDAPWLESYLEKMTKDQNTLEETNRRLLLNKLFAEVEKDLNITVQEVTEEEFANIPAQHQH